MAGKNIQKYKHLTTQVQKEQRKAYWGYIEKMICDIPLTDPDQNYQNSKPKKLFSYIKSIRTENVGVAPLKKDGKLHTTTKEKANILNNQFQSVFTSEPPGSIPDKGPSPHPDIQSLNITTPGIVKLLTNINPHKASGPDNIHGRILKELSEQIAPILQILFIKSASPK